MDTTLPTPIDVAELVHKRKLVLLIDLDETLVHSPWYTTLEECVRRRTPQQVQCVHTHTTGEQFYHNVFIRPKAQEFIAKMSSMFELYIAIKGLRSYAQALMYILDPEQKYLQRRFFARTIMDHQVQR